jgi:hypothetical protein
MPMPFVKAEQVGSAAFSEKGTEYDAPGQRVREQILLFLDVAAVRDAGGVGLQPYSQRQSPSRRPSEALLAVDSWGRIRGLGGLLHRTVHVGPRTQSELASLVGMVWSRARRGDGCARHCHSHHHGAI